MPISDQYWQPTKGKWRRPSAALRYHFGNGAALAAKSRQHIYHYWAKVGPIMISHLGRSCVKIRLSALDAKYTIIKVERFLKLKKKISKIVICPDMKIWSEV